MSTRRVTLVLALALSGAGCASAPKLRLVDDPRTLVFPKASDYPGADAVYLQREVHLDLLSRWTGQSYVTTDRHDVLAILTEAGYNRANIRVVVPEDGELVELEARTLAADGSAVPVATRDVHDASAWSTDDDGARVYSFAFPDVKVGSVIEFRYRTRVKGMMYDRTDYLSDTLPVQYVSVRLSGTSDIRYQTKIYNTDRKWHEEETSTGWALTWDARNLPAFSRDDFRPNETFHEPWWAFTIRQFARYNLAFDHNRTWPTAYAGRAHALYFDHEEHYKGLDAKLPVTPKSSVLEKVAAATDWLRQRGHVSKPGSYPGRKYSALPAKGGLTGVEHTRLLWKLLRDQGLDARYAFTQRRAERLEDRDLPLPSVYPTLLVYLPVQPGLPVPLWLDGACDFCAVGELPSWLRGREAMLLDAERDKPKKAKVNVTWLPITGPDAPMSRVERRYQVSLDVAGTATLQQDRRTIGAEASMEREYRHSKTDKEHNEERERDLRQQLPGATMSTLEFLPLEPSMRVAENRMRATVPRHAHVDGGLALVPLTALTTALGDYFEEPTRVRPIVFRENRVTHDEATYRVPAGWTAQDVPAPVSLETAGVACKAEAKVISPQEVRVVRTLSRTAGEYAVSDYPRFREVVRACATFRDGTLTFAVAPGP